MTARHQCFALLGPASLPLRAMFGSTRKPVPFSLNLFRSPQTYLRGAVPYPPASPKKAPLPPGGAFAFLPGEMLISASEKVADAAQQICGPKYA
jgi:hypothetical protein